MEKQISKSQREMESFSQDELNGLWEEAKSKID
jgi:uncharacterized protein YabN with tetrapyrrole methylase and pyrophosphatase domain